MRLASLLLVVLVAGCLGSPAPTPAAEASPFASHEAAAGAEGGAGSAQAASPAAASSTSLQDAVGTGSRSTPPPIHRESHYTIGLDRPSADGHPCSGPIFINCDRPQFKVDGTFDVEATLSWSAGSDLDLYLYQGDQQLSADGVNAGTDLSSTTQVLHYQDLPPGEYSAWVTVRYGVLGNYTLDIVFSPPT